MNAWGKVFQLLMLLCVGYATASAKVIPKIPYQHDIDSLESLIETNIGLEQKIISIYELSFYCSFSDSTKAHQYLNQALSIKTDNPIFLGMGKMYAGMFFMDYDIPKAIKLFEEADSEFEKFDTPQAKILQARTLNNLASAYQWEDKHVKMLDILINRALPTARQTDDNVVTGNILYKIGLNFWNNVQYVEANRYLIESISLLKKGKYDPFMLLEDYKLLILSLHAMDEHEKAKELIADFERFFKKHNGMLPMSDYHLVHAINFRFLKKYDIALIHLDKALEFLKIENVTNLRVISSILYQKVLINIAKGDYKSAFVDLQSKVEKQLSLKNAFFQDSLNVAIAYVKIYEGLKDYKKAMEWVRKKETLQDTMYSRRIRESIMDYEVKYQSLEKESEIHHLKAEREKAESDIKNARIISALIALLLILLGYFLFKNHQKNKRLLQQQEINNNQKLLEEKHKQKLMSLDAMLQGEEKERNRLSRDLHDGLGSILASIKYKVLDLQLSNPNHKVDSVLHDMDYAITEMRRISHNLMPESLRRFGLEVSLSDLCKSLQNLHTKIELQLYGTFESLSLENQTHIYRIIQELLYNSIKHSEAKHILVQCSMEDKVVFITVEDDGVGFQTNLLKANSKAGVGLKNVNLRVNYLHGKLDINSEVGKGTSVEIELFV